MVDDFLTHPYWYGSIFGIMIAASHSKTKPSRILLSTGVNEIGLKSLLMDVGRCSALSSFLYYHCKAFSKWSLFFHTLTL